MKTRIDCQTAGTMENGNPCPHFDSQFLCCNYTPKNEQPTCIYQIDHGITDNDLARREFVGSPEDVQQAIELVKSGDERLGFLYGAQVFKSVTDSLAIVDKYQPGGGVYHPSNLEDGRMMSVDIVHLAALGTHMSAVMGCAEADWKRLEAWRKQLYARKYIEIKRSYMIGLRRGKMTTSGVDQDVRCDPEYSECLENTLSAERQSLVLRGFYEAIIELVNALKRRVEALSNER